MDLMVSAHMDDFKSIGPHTELNWLRGVLSAAFGGDVNMLQDDAFIHTGINHTTVYDNNEPMSH